MHSLEVCPVMQVSPAASLHVQKFGHKVARMVSGVCIVCMRRLAKLLEAGHSSDPCSLHLKLSKRLYCALFQHASSVSMSEIPLSLQESCIKCKSQHL